MLVFGQCIIRPYDWYVSYIELLTELMELMSHSKIIERINTEKVQYETLPFVYEVLYVDRLKHNLLSISKLLIMVIRLS